jgi:hypothetical protein
MEPKELRIPKSHEVNFSTIGIKNMWKFSYIKTRKEDRYFFTLSWSAYGPPT